MANVGTAAVTIVPSMTGFSSALNSAFSGLSGVSTSAGKTVGSSFSSGFSAKLGAVAGIASTVASAAFNTVASSLDDAISRVDTLNNFPTVMQNLGYSAEEATASINALSDGIDGLPTTLDDIVSNTQLFAATLGDLDVATDTAIAVNNMFTAAGLSTSEASYATQLYNKALAANEITSTTWLALVSRAPGQLTQVAQAMLGAEATTEDLKEAISDGTYSMEDLNNAIIALNEEGTDSFASFSEQAQSATSGIATSMQNAKTAVIRNLANIIDAINSNGEIPAFFNSLKSVINTFGNAIVSVIPYIKELVYTFADELVSRLAPAGDAIEIVSSAITGVVDSIKAGTTPIEAFKDAVEQAASGLSERFPAAAEAIQNIQFDDVSNSFAGVLTSFVTSSDGVISALEYMRDIGSQAIDTLASKFETRFPEASSAIETAFDTVKEVFNQFIDNVSAGVEIFKTSTSGIIDSVTAFAEAFVGAFAIEGGAGGLASLVSTLSGLVTPFGLVASIVREFGAELAELATSVGASLVPVMTSLGQVLGGAIATALPAVEVAISAVFSIIQAIIPTISNLAATILPTIATVIQNLAPVIQQVVTFVSNLVTALAPLIANLVSSLLPVITNIVTALMNFVTAVAPVISSVLTTIMSLINALLPVLTSIISVVVSIVTTIVTYASLILTTVVNVISVITSAIGTVITVISNVLQVIISVFSGIVSTVTTAIASVVSLVTSGFNGAANIVSTVVNAIGSFITGLFSKISTVFNNIVSVITSAVNNAFSAARTAFNKIVSTVSSAISNVLSTVGKIPSKIQSTFANAGSWLTSVGKNIITGLINGITSNISKIGDTLLSGIKSAVNSVKSFLGIASPSKLFAEIGGFTMQGMANGIESEASTVRKTMESAMDDVYSAASGEISLSATASIESAQAEMDATVTNDSSSLIDAINMLHADLQAIYSIIPEGITTKEWERKVRKAVAYV